MPYAGMEKPTVNLSIKKLLIQLDKVRGCYTCKEKKDCDRYKFVKDATEALVQENGFEDSFMGQAIVWDLCWIIADEASLSGVISEGGEELYYNDELSPLLEIVDSLREHKIKLAELILKMREKDQEAGENP